MSRGLGSMQQWIDGELLLRSKGRTVAEMLRSYLEEEEREIAIAGRHPDLRDNLAKRSNAKDHPRAVRHSMTRALRKLERLGKVRREGDVWQSVEAVGAEHTEEAAKIQRRRETAYHEAGHAVIGLAAGLPVALAAIRQDRTRLGFVAHAREPASVGYVYKKQGKSTRLDTKSRVTTLDAFGNQPRKREFTADEHHAEVVMCIAGPMADAKALGITDWRKHASSSDMSIARHHRSKLGDAARSWEQYEQDTAALVNKYWAMVEAVAARLMKVDFLSADEIDSICRRVVRRQHLRGRS